MSTDGSRYDLQVWMKSPEWETKKRLDIIAKVDNGDYNDTEKKIYDTLLDDVTGYMLVKEIKPLLPIPEYFKVDEKEENKDVIGWSNNMFLIENPNQIGFNACSLKNQNGLDYEQSVLVISALAKFHAAVYCFRKEKKVDLTMEYPAAVNKALFVPKISNEAIVRLEVIFQSTSEHMKYSKMFIDAAKGKHQQFGTKLEQFGVLCHGNLLPENILIKYTAEDLCKLSCSQVMFRNLSNCFYGSCVLDLLQIIFTVVNIGVRENFLADLVCSVYYDSFAKSVVKFNTGIPLFTKKEFMKEFDFNIMYGFLLSLNLCSIIHQEALDREKVTSASYVRHKEFILSVVRDIIQFKINVKTI